MNSFPQCLRFTVNTFLWFRPQKQKCHYPTLVLHWYHWQEVFTQRQRVQSVTPRSFSVSAREYSLPGDILLF